LDLQSLKIDRGPQRPPTRNGRRRNRPFGWLGLLVIGLVASSAWLFWPRLAAVLDDLRLPAVQTYLITELRPAAAAAVLGTAANGYIVAARRAALSSDVPGRIVELAVREGSVVQKGEVVARLFADEFRAALARAVAEAETAAASVARATAASVAATADRLQVEASVAALAAQVEEAQAQLQFAQLECARQRDLLASGAGSGRELERASSEAEALQARVRTLAANLTASATSITAAQQRCAVADADIRVAEAQAKAALAAQAQAAATLDKTDVRAPFDGIVVLKDAEVGEVVSPNVQGGSNARGAVCTLVDFDSLEVQANVPETTLAAVQIGAPAVVFLDAFPEERYEGRVDRIWPTADRQKATIEVRVKLLRRDERLRPEMGVRVVFERQAEAAVAASAAPAAGRDANLVLVPETALFPLPAGTPGAGDPGTRATFVIERDVVRLVTVSIGERRSNQIAVRAGLAVGQRLVLQPPTSLQDGDRVRLLPN